MTALESCGIAEPEIVSGLGADWKNYTPPGSVGFQKFLREEYIPGLDASRTLVQSRRDMLNSASVEIAEMRKIVSAYLDLTAKFNRGEVKSILGECADDLGKDNVVAGKVLNALENFKIDQKEMAAIETDIALLDAIKEYFIADCELDMCLYANDLIPVRFRTKVFRHLMKVLRRVEADILVIDHSPSEMKEIIMKPVRQGYDETKKCYDILSPGLRKERKMIDKYGNEYWEKYHDPATCHRIYQAEAAAKAMADVIRNVA